LVKGAWKKGRASETNNEVKSVGTAVGTKHSAKGAKGGGMELYTGTGEGARKTNKLGGQAKHKRIYIGLRDLNQG